VTLRLFEGYGVEIECMIVDAQTLDVKPVCDELLRLAAGEITGETEQGGLCWSNELVLHVVELKTNGPAPSLAPLPDLFQRHVLRIEALLEPLGARLLPTGMHPWMDPGREMHLWPHDNGPVYAAFHRIFDCTGHGWANLQSAHLNLPFSGDSEFGRLHAAVRLVLPLLPALAASSPLVEGRATGLLDNRLDVYRTNARHVPIVSGKVVPERAFTRAAYETRIFEPLYAAIGPLDPDGILRHEWLNARGAIARFDRDAIEIRVIDTQECPLADLSVAAITVAAVRALTEERWTTVEEQQSFTEDELLPHLLACIRDAEQAHIGDRRFARQFGWGGGRGGEFWAHLAAELPPAPPFDRPLQVILEEGTLARRILRSTAPPRLVYGELADCLREGRMFHGVP